jgi:hypothetical protein
MLQQERGVKRDAIQLAQAANEPDEIVAPDFFARLVRRPVPPAATIAKLIGARKATRKIRTSR